MKPTRTILSGVRRRGNSAARLAALFALLMVATLLAACSDSPPPGGGGGGNPATFESTDDRPIIVTGGSIDLDYNPDDYRPAGGNAFRSTNNRVTELRIYDDDGSDHSDLRCRRTFAGDSSITINYSVQGGGGSGTISVNSTNANSTPQIDLSYDTTTFPPRSSSRKKHYNTRARVDSVTVNEPGAGTPAPTPSPCGVPPNGKATIEIIGLPVTCHGMLKK